MARLMAYREQAIRLGARKSLVGILALPAAPQDAGTAPAEVPAVVILNAGIIHRTGPNRLHTTLARALASDGFPALRFDLAGIGDSESRAEALPPTEAALADIQEVLDDLEAAGRTGRGVILVGLCSGAFEALLCAEADPRVVGTVLIDLYLPKTAGFYLRHYAHRAKNLESWFNVLRGRNPLWRALKGRLAPGGTREEAAQNLPVLEPDLGGRPLAGTFEHAFVAALKRGVQVLAIFTGGLRKQHNYREQLLDAFPRVPFGTLLRLEYFADSDHTFTPEAVRARFIRLVREWVRSAAFVRPAGRSHE
jgi:hypothetical protein